MQQSFFSNFTRQTIIAVICCIVFPVALYPQAQLKNEADQFFQEGNYREAATLYKAAGIDATSHKTTRLHYGISLYETNAVNDAMKVFQSLINEGKTEAPVFFFMAKSQQSNNNYAEAIAFYKRFLQRSDSNDPLRIWVKDELIRCANGSRLKHADEKAYVENAGPEINTPFSEFGVHHSPTIIDKIYFNSDRGSIQHGSQRANIDIYSAALVNGRWSVPAALPSHINSPSYNEVAGFSSDGQVLYYITSVNNHYSFMADTFSGEEGVVYKGLYNAPYHPEEHAADLTFFNDSICLFASMMPGGYGGYDLYISVLDEDQWSTPVNLGPAINSFYNERFPFLTKDGETLFYSSDNLESIGGLDVFKTTFDATTLGWSIPENMGLPINSSQDDTHLVISPDGLSAFLSSDRKEGFGGYDLYRVFFKEPIEAHQRISYLPTFYQTILIKGEDLAAVNVLEKKVDVKEYFISHLFIEKGSEILTPQNTKKLDLLANLLLIYPRIKAELICFTLPEGPRTFNLFFSVKEAEKAAKYLESKGIAKGRVMIKGYGSSFPLAKDPPGMANSPVYLKLNHRLEINLHNEEGEPVIAHLENIPVPDNLLDPKGGKFISLRHGLYFSVQIASVTQMLQNPNLEVVDEMFVEVEPEKGNYQYMVGMSSAFTEALQRLEQMNNLGFYDAFIIAYVDGIRLAREEAINLVHKYPELQSYLDHVRD